MTNGMMNPGVKPIELLTPCKMPVKFGATSIKHMPNPATMDTSLNDNPMVMRAIIQYFWSTPIWLTPIKMAAGNIVPECTIF